VRNWYGYCWTSGDNIVEQHVHNLDIANWVLGAHPDAVVASGGRAWKPLEEKYGDLFDHFSCDYEYPGGMHMFSFSRHWNNSHNDVMEEAIGSKRSVKCWELGEAGENPYYQEHRNLVNSIRGDGPKYHEARQVCDSTLTGIMGRTAAYTGKRVTWDEALNDELVIVPEAWSFDAEYPVRPVPVPGS
jgi:predicted dehydrogenase